MEVKEMVRKGQNINAQVYKGQVIFIPGGGGEISPEAIKEAVDEYLEANPPAQGAPGKDGADGKDGAPGQDGYTPVKGVDYFTPEEVQEIAEQAAKMVEVPNGIDVTGAKVGQTVKVAEVDENGRPTEWEAADVTTSWDFINGITLQEDSAETIINCDSNGNPFGYRALLAYVLSKNASSQSVTFVSIGSTGHTLWKTGEASNIQLGSGTSCTVTHEVMGERIVRNSISTLSATHKEGWSYKTNGIHTQEEAYKYLTGYMIFGTLAAGSLIEVYGYGKVTE